MLKGLLLVMLVALCGLFSGCAQWQYGVERINGFTDTVEEAASPITDPVYNAVDDTLQTVHPMNLVSIVVKLVQGEFLSAAEQVHILKSFGIIERPEKLSEWETKREFEKHSARFVNGLPSIRDDFDPADETSFRMSVGILEGEVKGNLTGLQVELHFFETFSKMEGREEDAKQFLISARKYKNEYLAARFEFLAKIEIARAAVEDSDDVDLKCLVDMAIESTDDAHSQYLELIKQFPSSTSPPLLINNQ